MSHRSIGILHDNVEDQSVIPSSASSGKSSKSGRFRSVLSFFILIGAIFRVFQGSTTTTTVAPNPNDEMKKLGMSNETSAPTSAAKTEKSEKSEDRSILSTVLDQSGSVASETDDLFERAATSDRDEFKRTLESEINGLRGFNASIKTLVGR